MDDIYDYIDMKEKILITALLICLISLSSCKKDELRPQGSIEWIRIEVPEASAIYSMSGNIENELIIGGAGEISKSSDQGLTWAVVQNNFIAYELRKRQDTLFAIALYNQTYQDFYSLDNGDNWELSPNKSLEDLRTNIVTSSNGTIYKIVRPETYPKQPDQVFTSSDGGSTWSDIFPYKRWIYSIYLDENDRLYIGTNKLEWDENTNSFRKNNGNNSGVIFYMK